MAKLFDFTIKNGAAGGFGMFSAAHFAWLAALLAAGGGVCLAYKKADENSRRVIRRAAAWGALGMELLRAALLFAAGHLPATVGIFGTLTPPVLVRCFLLNGGFGLVFGRLYRRCGIQYAMLSHAVLHIVSKLIWTIFA